MSNLWKALRDVSRDSDHSVGFEPALGSDTPAPHPPPLAPKPSGAPAAAADSQLEPGAGRPPIPGRPAPRPRSAASAGPAAAAPVPTDGKPRLAPLESPLRRRVGGTGVPLDKPRSPLGNGNASGISPKPRSVSATANATGTGAGDRNGAGTPRLPRPAADSAAPTSRGPAAGDGSRRVPRPGARASLLDTIREAATGDAQVIDTAGSPRTPTTAPAPAVTVETAAPSTFGAPATFYALRTAGGDATALPAAPSGLAPRPPVRPSGNGHTAGDAPTTTGFPSSPVVAAPLRPAKGAPSYLSYGSPVVPSGQPASQWKPGDDDVIPSGGRKVARRPRLKDRLPW